MMESRFSSSLENTNFINNNILENSESNSFDHQRNDSSSSTITASTVAIKLNPNQLSMNCYCRNPQVDMTTIESPIIICSSCSSLFHSKCIQNKSTGSILQGDSSYTFICNTCNHPKGEELFIHTKSWVHISVLTLYNLYLRRTSPRDYFHLSTEIVPFILSNWNKLCYGRYKTTNWMNTLSSTLETHKELFIQSEEYGQHWYSLKTYTDPLFTFNISLYSTPPLHTKRKKRKRKELTPDPSTIPPLSEKPSLRTKFPRNYADQFTPTPSSTQPEEPIHHDRVVIDRTRSAVQMVISESWLTVNNSKGYRTAIATHGFSSGCYYYECKVDIPTDKNPHGAARLGWSTREGDVQAPVGYDDKSYSYRSGGGKVHESYRSEYGKGYKGGDVIGFLLRLNKHGENSMRFFVNGEDQGVAFDRVKEGTYYPAISLYYSAEGTFNFGDEFEFPPPKEFDWKPISHLVQRENEAIRRERERSNEQGGGNKLILRTGSGVSVASGNSSSGGDGGGDLPAAGKKVNSRMVSDEELKVKIPKRKSNMSIANLISPTSPSFNSRNLSFPQFHQNNNGNQLQSNRVNNNIQQQNINNNNNNHHHQMQFNQAHFFQPRQHQQQQQYNPAAREEHQRNFLSR